MGRMAIVPLTVPVVSVGYSTAIGLGWDWLVQRGAADEVVAAMAWATKARSLRRQTTTVFGAMVKCQCCVFLKNFGQGVTYFMRSGKSGEI
jgi:hypothetical protein